MRVYVINLDGSDDRWRNISSQLDTLGLGYERVSAVNGRLLDLRQVADDAVCRRHMGRSLQPGEVGCGLSHKNALEMFLKSGDAHAVILEDDALVEPITGSVLDWIGQQIDMKGGWAVNIGPADTKYATLVAEKSGVKLFCAHRFPIPTTGIMWSRQGAKHILDRFERVTIPFDNFLRTEFAGTNRGFSVAPKLAKVAPFNSDIEAVSDTVSRTRLDRSTLYYIKKHRRTVSEAIGAMFAMLRWRLGSGGKNSGR